MSFLAKSDKKLWGFSSIISTWSVCVDDLATAAEEYGLLNSDAWKQFAEVVSYSKSAELNAPSTPAGEPSKGKEASAPKATEPRSGSDKPSQKEPDIPKESTAQHDLSEKDTVIEKLKREIESYLGKIAMLENQIAERDEKNASLETRLSQSEQKSSTSRAKLTEAEKKLLSMQQELKESTDRYNALREQIAAGAKGETALRAEISRLEGTLKNLGKEKLALESEFAALQKKYASAERQIEVGEDFQFQLQDSIRSLNAQIIQLNSDLEEANKRLEEANEATVPVDGQKETEPSEIEIFGRCCYYLNYPCLESGKEWLKAKLPKVAKDYMTVCFMPSLTPSQTRTANEKGWTTIYDFDLASILRVIKFNLRSIPSFIPSRKDEITVSDMIEIRNEYAHSNGWDITNENAIDDISTMSDFIKLMGGDRETIDEMQDFMSTIPV